MRPKIGIRLAKEIFDRDNGRCTHCHKKLCERNRRSWHIDHYPIPYRDVESQYCCGVTDPLLSTNLVLSCAKCNLSHKHEKDHEKWYYGGRTQCFCTKRCVHRLQILLALMCTATCSSVVTWLTFRCP